MTLHKTNNRTLDHSLSLAIETYDLNKEKEKGAICCCPVCGMIFEKTRKKHAFCSNWYSKEEGTQDCKTQFWLAVRRKAYQASLNKPSSTMQALDDPNEMARQRIAQTRVLHEKALRRAHI